MDNMRQESDQSAFGRMTMRIESKSRHGWSARIRISAVTSSLALAAMVSFTPGLAREPVAADLVLKNGRVYTVDGSHRVAEAMAVKKGKLVFVGSNAAVEAYIGRKTVVEDAGGKLVLPGLVDAHIHPVGIVDFGGCDLQATARTLAEIAVLVRQCIVDAKLQPGQWLAVSQWEYAAGNQTDSKYATLRAALDDAAPDNPVIMTGWDFHHSAYNSRALALAKNAKGEVVGYSKKTLQTDFAQYKAVVGVDSNGEPSGDIQDEGRSVIDSSETSRQDFAKLLAEPQRLAQQLNSRGITAIWDAATSASGGLFGPDSMYDVYDKLQKNGQQSFRVNMAQLWEPEDFRDGDGRVNWDALFTKADAIKRKYAGNPLASADSVKIFADGGIEANPNNTPPTFGAALRPVPYLQPIFEKDAQGFLSVKDYVDISSPECAYVRAAPGELTSEAAIADFTKRYGFHPGQCAISYGIPQHAPWIFEDYVMKAHLKGYTVHIHTISDAAVDMALDAIEAARKADGVTTRPDTLAHIQCATAADLKRIGDARLNIAYTYSWMYAEPKGYDLSTIPFFDKVHGNSYEALHDPKGYFEQCTYPAKASKDAGAVLIAGSDAPVLTQDPQPFVNMEIGMTRSRRGGQPLSPWQRLSIEEVIDAYTINGARALNRGAEIGSLEVGKSADFIIVDQDILELARSGRPEKIGDTKVLGTWFMGKKVYSPSSE